MGLNNESAYLKNEDNSPDDKEKLEDKFFSLLNQLPSELQKHWRDRLRFEDNPRKAVAGLMEIIRRREDALNQPTILKRGIILESNLSKEEKIRRENLIGRIIDEVKRNGLGMIGEGRTSQVFVSEVDSRFCYKVIVDTEVGQRIYRQGNNVAQEVDYLDMIISRMGDRALVPKPYYYQMGPNIHFYVMERIPGGIDLEKILTGEVSLPQNFDLEKFSHQLRIFIQEMNQIGIYHRDFISAGRRIIYGRNIMIDKDNNPWVIDFGSAVMDFGEDSVFRKGMYISDEEAIERIIDILKSKVYA